MHEQIITFLKDASGYISGEEISRQINISRAAVWKYMQELRLEGYDIVAVPHLGYRLISCPDKLLPAEIQSGLKTKMLGKDIRYFDSLPSTMDEAFRRGVEGAGEGMLVCAECQTKGKGRLGRSWMSPKGKGIYMSVILRPPLAPADVAMITLLGAVAVCEVIHQFCKIPAQIKWPNDILVNGQKMAGLLTELSAEMDRVRFVVIGIGLNVNTPANQMPSTATSLKVLTGKKHSRVELVQEMLKSLETWYDCLKSKGFGPIVERWKIMSSTLGRHVRVVDPSGNVEGTAVDLDPQGGLVIRTVQGQIVKRMTGDVVQESSIKNNKLCRT